MAGGTLEHRRICLNERPRPVSDIANVFAIMKTLAAIPGLAWLSRASTPSQTDRAVRIGLCLSSGAARGLAHIGVIQVLEENKIPITAIAGTSMGAYVGALWAAGFDGRQLEGLAREIKDPWSLLRLLDPVFPPSRGLIRGERIRRHLERSLAGVTFADLRTPMLIMATDLETMTPHVFEQGLVAEAVIASAAIPGVCLPIAAQGRLYTDGGASAPMPVSLLGDHFELDHIIAVNVLPTPYDLEICAKPAANTTWNPLRCMNLLARGNVLDTFQRALRAAQVQLIAKESLLADVVLHPFLCESTWRDFHHFDRFIKAGREAATQALPQLLTLTQGGKSTGGYHHEPTASHTDLGRYAA